MSLTNNSYFLLGSAQLFPVIAAESVPEKSDDAALTAAIQAFLSYQSGQLETAREQYTEAIQHFPDQPFFYACRSIMNMILEDDEGAFYDYQVAKKMDFNYHTLLEWIENRPSEQTEDSEYHHYTNREIHSAALEATQQFDCERALELYTYGIEKYPQDILLLVFRGSLYQRLLRYDKSLADLNQAIAMDPVCYEAYMMRAKLFKVIREVEKAKVDFNKSVELQSQEAILFEERGGFLTELGDYDDALKDLNKVVQLLPEDFYVYALRADLYEKMENWEAAMQDYSQAIALNPHYSDLYAYRANMKERLGDLAGAAKDREMFEELEQED